MPVDDISKRALADAVPLFLPAIPFGLVLGVAITESAMPTWVGWLTNLVIFGGAAQLATVTLAGTSAWLTVVATAAVINLRHVMYSAALAPRFSDQPRWFRWIGPFVLIDQTFALASIADDLDTAAWRRYYLTIGGFFFSSWLLVVSVGLVAGSAIPSSWRLDVAPAVMFAGMVVVGISKRPGWIAAAVGAVGCLAGLGLPHNGGIFVGALAGITAGYLADRFLGEDPAPEPDPAGERR